MIDIIHSYDYLRILSQPFEQLILGVWFGKEKFIVFALVHAQMATQLLFGFNLRRESLANSQKLCVNFEELA